MPKKEIRTKCPQCNQNTLIKCEHKETKEEVWWCENCNCEVTEKSKEAPFGEKTLQNSPEQKAQINVRNLIRILTKISYSDDVLRKSIKVCKMFIESQEERSK